MNEVNLTKDERRLLAAEIENERELRVFARAQAKTMAWWLLTDDATGRVLNSSSGATEDPQDQPQGNGTTNCRVTQGTHGDYGAEFVAQQKDGRHPEIYCSGNPWDARIVTAAPDSRPVCQISSPGAVSAKDDVGVDVLNVQADPGEVVTLSFTQTSGAPLGTITWRPSAGVFTLPFSGGTCDLPFSTPIMGDHRFASTNDLKIETPFIVTVRQQGV